MKEFKIATKNGGSSAASSTIHNDHDIATRAE